MLDTHTVPSGNWGLLPYLKMGATSIPTYSLFVFLAVATGIGLYSYEMRRRRSPHNFAILIAAFVGGMLGAKLPYVFQNIHLYLQGVRDPEILFSGRTILGGLIGGTLAVKGTKHWMGIRQRNGDFMITGICVGIALGRLGCLLRGCCYGKATSMPWGIDFGDGIPRHPTELYELIFVLAWLVFLRGKRTEQGFYFAVFMLSYFTFRFLNEFLRTEAILAAGLTGFQYVCLLVIGWFCLRIKYGHTREQSDTGKLHAVTATTQSQPS